MVFGAEAPWRLFVPPEEFDARVELKPSLCVVDRKYFFARGHIELPVHGQSQPFAWSVWCSVSEDSFARMMRDWNSPARVGAVPYFAWLYTSLPTYGAETLHLKTLLHEREPGLVPLVELEESDHPLSVEQRVGIDMRRVHEIAHAVLGHE
jgi:hypothetical protein